MSPNILSGGYRGSLGSDIIAVADTLAFVVQQPVRGLSTQIDDGGGGMFQRLEQD